VPEHASPDNPPDGVEYGLEDALALLAALEDARDALIVSGHLAVVVAVESEIRYLSRRLEFDDSPGGQDG
jgi:hypothetical protein